MRLIFLSLFVLLPVIEIALFVQIGSEIGAMATVALVLGAAFLGIILMRFQGFQTWRRVEAAMARGEPPVAEMFQGVLLFAAAILLILPGFFSDAIALLLLLPPVRQFLAARLVARGGLQFTRGGMAGGMGAGFPGNGFPGQGPMRGEQGGPIIDGEAEEITEDATRLHGPDDGPNDSPWRR